jgi:protein O-GlcNAc transferase
VFAVPLEPKEHLARIKCADLFLVTLPYNAHTTASDALWAGVPVLTCEGTTFAGRVASSLLHAIDLQDLVTQTLADYERMAVQLARTPSLITEIRSRLALNRMNALLFDTQQTCRHIESAFTTVMKRFHRGEAPVSFAVRDVM